MEEKIDFVITWVDGNDKEWQSEKQKYDKFDENNDILLTSWNNNIIRYRDWELLKYWFRGVEKNAPWVNKIFFITYGHLPEWLNLNNEKLVIINHKDFIPKQYLPTFNSNAIELNMHRINDLSKYFVYFNDDMYILKKTKKTDFFRNGLPCETAGLDCVALDWNIGHSEIKNLQLINKYFSKKKVLKEYWYKWFSPVNGKQLVKTLLLLPWSQFTGLYEGHIPSSYLKDTFSIVWEKEESVLDSTCKTRFRENNNVNHWLFKNWQLMTGNFIPRNSKIGKMYLKNIDGDILNTVKKKKYKVVCINDVECTQKEFELYKKKINEAFETIFPLKSSFEI